MLRSENRDYDLGARILSGEATSEEVTYHEQWLAADPIHRQEWDEMVHAWNAASDAVRLRDVDVDEGWKTVKRQLRIVIKPAWYTLLVNQRIAAGIILLFAMASVIWWLKPVESVTYEEIMVYSTAGEDVVLPDGSVVSLSSESSLAYTVPFKTDRRLVKFSGEAFFQVEGNPEWPFLIETSDLTIKVTGTSFNVRSWPHQPASFVDVSSGKVEVSAKSDNIIQIVEIESGLRAVFSRKSNLLERTMADPNFLAWKTRRIEFQDADLNLVFETLENVYRVKIRVADASILDERMGATFSHNSLDYITGVVCATFDLECTSDKDVLFFSRRKS